jgi:predicted secreted hydrolase
MACTRLVVLFGVVLALSLGLALSPGCGTDEGETFAYGPPQVHFPQDEGAHPDSPVEWWYGNFALTDSEGREYGAMVAYFNPPLKIISITDLEAQTFHHEVFTLDDDYAEGGLDLRWGDSDRWYRPDPDSPSYQLEAYGEEIGMDLDIVSEKPALTVGGDSLVEWVAGNSYYYSLTRLDTEGQLQLPDRSIDVEGIGWMDHQWMDALSEGGWDWFSVQLDDGTDLIFWQVVNPDESVESRDLTIMFADNSIYHTEVLELESSDPWTSPDTGNEYGTVWRVREQAHGVDLEITARHAEQEILMSAAMPGSDWAFWEGRMSVSGLMDGEDVSGTGYAELVRFPSADESSP